MRLSLGKILILVPVLGYAAWWSWTAWAGYRAEQHFRYKCDNFAGEFIFRTIDNVEGLYQMRPRDPREYFSRLRAGDLPGDPFGHTNLESEEPWNLFLSLTPDGYKFFESKKGPKPEHRELQRKTYMFEEPPIYTGEEYWRFTRAKTRNHNGLLAKQVSQLKSRFGFTWREIREESDLEHGVYGGELLVKDLKADETIAIRRGYFFWGPGKRSGICPEDKTDSTTVRFVQKVLIPPLTEDQGGDSHEPLDTRDL
jgi:hypothetical protein